VVPRRLHLVLHVSPSTHRVTAVCRRLWGEWDSPRPVIRLQLDPPAGVDWSWPMTCIARDSHELPVPDDWEQLTGQERHAVLRDYVLGKYDARSVQPDRFKTDVRKQPGRV
jgi:hypothetical protein